MLRAMREEGTLVERARSTGCDEFAALFRDAFEEQARRVHVSGKVLLERLHQDERFRQAVTQAAAMDLLRRLSDKGS